MKTYDMQAVVGLVPDLDHAALSDLSHVLEMNGALDPAVVFGGGELGVAAQITAAAAWKAASLFVAMLGFALATIGAEIISINVEAKNESTVVVPDLGASPEQIEADRDGCGDGCVCSLSGTCDNCTCDGGGQLLQIREA